MSYYLLEGRLIVQNIQQDCDKFPSYRGLFVCNFTKLQTDVFPTPRLLTIPRLSALICMENCVASKRIPRY